MSFRHSSPPTRHKHPKMDAKNGSRTTPPPPHPGPAVAQLRTRVWKLPEAATLGPAQAPTRKRQPRGLDAQLTTEQRAPLAPAPEASSIERPDARRTCHFNHLAATLQLTYSGIGPRAMAHSEGCPQKECAAARNVFHVLDAGSVTSRILDPGPLIRSTPFERHPAFLCVLDETRRSCTNCVYIPGDCSSSSQSTTHPTALPPPERALRIIARRRNHRPHQPLYASPKPKDIKSSPAPGTFARHSRMTCLLALLLRARTRE